MNKAQNETKRPSRIRTAFASSVIFSALDRASAWIYKKLSRGVIGGIFTAYKRENTALSESALTKGIAHLDISKRVMMPAKRAVSRSIEHSAILHALKRMLRALLSGSMKSYGIFTFSAALYSAIAYIFHILYFKDVVFAAPDVVVFAVMIISSVMMIASRQSLAGALTSSPAASFILFGVMGLRRESFDVAASKEERFNIPFIAGLVFGILAFFVSPLNIIFGIFALIAAYTVLVVPEFGVLAIITALPFVPTAVLSGAVLYTAVCYLIKVMCGKRSMKFDLLDLTVLAFMVLTLFGGLVSTSQDSIPPALLYCVFMLGYFLVVNLIRSKQWAMRCIIGVMSSSVIVSAVGLYQNFFGLGEDTLLGTVALGDIEGRIASTFENSSVLAQYLIMVMPLIVASLIVMKHPRARLALIFALVASCMCLVYTWSRGAWLGFIIGIIVFFLMYNRKTLTALLFGAFAVPFLHFVLPEAIVHRLTGIGNMTDAQAAFRENLWGGVTNMLGDYWQCGIGIGEGAFSRIYRQYAFAAIENAPHTHNLYLQILTELGAIGLIVFLLVIIVWAQSTLTLHKEERRPEKLYSVALFSGVFSVLLQGMTDHVWYNYRVFLMFWLLVGLACAVRKTLDATAADEII